LVTGRARFTHRELERAVDRWAQALCKVGIGRGDRVPIVALVDHRNVLAMLALAKLGAVAVPINTRWTVPEVSYALGLLEPKSLVADEALMDLAVEAARGAANPVGSLRSTISSLMPTGWMSLRCPTPTFRSKIR
jgi:acyl-coenzyme A synthetase/AMP-(fatty) acid ligase